MGPLNKYNSMKMTKRKISIAIALMISFLTISAQENTETLRQYLSGHGCDDMVSWNFYCTKGRQSGKWTKIGVPSCWELQGFGTYQYGMRFYGKPTPEGIADEEGLYRYEFLLPKEWEGRQIELVFEAVMTDARVTINGRKAGNGVHQGGFYRFSYDVTDRIYFGQHKNLLEVTVSKESANSAVNMAERRADYWNFGGIFRPVFVVSKPIKNIERVAIDAGMTGEFKAECFLSRAMDGAKVKTAIVDNQGKTIATDETDVRGDHANVDFVASKPHLWTAETPNLYTAVFTLTDNQGHVIHHERQRFGFRTIEYRQSDGVYVNGRKVIFKGVCRHSFRPESGRTLSKAKCIEDVKLIKSMNMNAVRLSHYPADPEFLDACDSLGLYVESELSGWHFAHETIVGRRLVKEMVIRDENHPSIIFWSNGNEGGFNYELEPEFARWDKQHRVVIYPWANRNGFETKHYRSWGETQEYMRQPEIFMPTEFLHGLYDGGHGAGLKDYWDMMMSNPRCAGGFLWDLADEGVVRTDEDGIVDCMGNFGADGIVGPHFEKEGSYYAIKEIWSPIEIEPIKDKTTSYKLKNHYDFQNLSTCTLAYKYLHMPLMGQNNVDILQRGNIKVPSAEPHDSAIVNLPTLPRDCQVVELTAIDSDGDSILTRSFKINMSPLSSTSSADKYTYLQNDQELVVSGCGRTYTFDKLSGYLKSVMIGSRAMSFGNGPRFLAARRADRSYDQFYNHDDKEAEKKKTQYAVYQDHGRFERFEFSEVGGRLIVKALYKLGSLMEASWSFGADGIIDLDYKYRFGGVVDEMGVMFDYPETKVKGKSWLGNGPYRVWQNRLQGPHYGYWHTPYNDPIPGESWEYPEFKGYFAQVDWMQLSTTEGKIDLWNRNSDNYVGVYQPRDGRDQLLYTLPESGISILHVIPAVRNKVNATDLNGPSAQPHWLKNEVVYGGISLKFE